MGADGGTIPTRDELVKVKKKPEKKDKAADLAHKWNDCAITQQPLVKPIMACEYGTLYNKESIIEMLLDMKKFENCANFSHIRNLKDVKELNFTDNNAFVRVAQKGDNYFNLGISPYSCPVTGLEMNGKHRFCMIWTCGCVMSERALKEVSSPNCHKCAKPYNSDDIVVLNGDDDTFELMKERMIERRALAKLAKKQKRTKKATETEVTETGEPATKKEKKASTETLKEKKKSDSSKAKSKAVGEASGSSGDSKKYKSIQDDPNASKVLKGLFTSSDEAKSQPKPHSGWITFNPQYFR